MQASSLSEQLVGVGQQSAVIAAGVNTTTLRTGPGRVGRILVTTAGTTSFTIFDNTAGSGKTIYVSPSTTTVGQVIDLQFPVDIGITIVNTATGPAIAVSFD